MANRFYQTTDGRFVDKNIYQAPWELAQGVIETHEKRTDQLVGETELLSGAVDTLKHLDFDAENKRVKALQDKYGTTIDDLTSAIYKNPLEYQKHAPAIKKAQRDLLQDRSSGEWFNIETRYNEFQKWQENNKDIKETNPTLYNQLSKHWYDDVVKRGTEDSTARFKGKQIIDKPDLIKGYREHFENIKANAKEYKDGMYKIKNKWVSEEEVAGIAWNTLISDPNYQGFVNQMGTTLGLPGYTDDKGNPIKAFKLVDEKGNTITNENYNKMTAEEKKKVGRVLNPNNAFFSDLASVTKTYGFSEQGYDADPFSKLQIKGQIDAGLQAQKTRDAELLEQQKQQYRLQLEAAKDAGDMDLLERKYELMGEKDQADFKNDLLLESLDGDEGSKKAYEILIAKETVGALGNPTTNLGADQDLINTRKEQGGVFENDGQTYVYATPGTVEYAALQRTKNATTHARADLDDQTIKLENGASIQGRDYFDWLGDRNHTEDTAKEYLDRQLNITQRSSLDASGAQQTADNLRWTPGWTKANAAKDWDKIYELGNQYEEKRNQWYENNNQSTNQVSLQPINNLETSKNLLTEIKNNPQSYTLTDSNGNVPKGMRNIMNKIDTSSPAFVTSANAHSEMGVKVEVDGESYYVFPDATNRAATDLTVNIAMMGVDKDSQFFLEMMDRNSTTLLHELNSAGQNSKGTKSIVKKVNGINSAIELVGDQVHLRKPDQALTDPAIRVFPNMRSYLRAAYGVDMNKSNTPTEYEVEQNKLKAEEQELKTRELEVAKKQDLAAKKAALEARRLELEKLEKELSNQ